MVMNESYSYYYLHYFLSVSGKLSKNKATRSIVAQITNGLVGSVIDWKSHSWIRPWLDWSLVRLVLVWNSTWLNLVLSVTNLWLKKVEIWSESEV